MKAAYFALVLLLVGAGCSTPASESSTVADVTSSPRIDFTDESLSTGNDTLTFNLLDKQGGTLTADNLKVVHEKLLHLIVVSDDLKHFYHLHPDFSNNIWTVDTNITTPGTYRVYADIAPIHGDALVMETSLNVSGDIVKEPETEETIEAKLATVDPLTAGIDTELLFRLTEDGKAVEQIDPYLGAYGHVVGLRKDDASIYLHVHPITETSPEDGIVKFATTFPSTGTYHLFAQFNVNGEIKTFPFLVDVAEGSGMMDMDHMHH